MQDSGTDESIYETLVYNKDGILVSGVLRKLSIHFEK